MKNNKTPLVCDGRKRVITAVSALCIAALFLCSCSAMNTLFGTTDTTATPYPATPSPSASPTPEVTPFSINPIYDFCNSYAAASQTFEQQLARALGDEGTLEAFKLSMQLTSHITYISEPRVTVCRLFEDDYGEYSGAVDGAGAGSGTVSSTQPNVYDFEYTYSGDENGLQGKYREALSMLEFSFGTYEYTTAPSPLINGQDGLDQADEEAEMLCLFSPTVACSIKKTADGWSSTVDDGSSVTYLVLNGESISFTCGSVTATLEGGALTFENDLQLTGAEVSEG